MTVANQNNARLVELCEGAKKQNIEVNPGGLLENREENRVENREEVINSKLQVSPSIFLSYSC